MFEQTKKTSIARTLGIYLLICAALQAGFYGFRTYPQSPDFSILFRPEFEGYGGVFYWSSAIWLFIIGAAIVAKPENRIPIRFYVVLETLTAIPRVVFMLLHYSFSGGILGGLPLHVDAVLGLQIAVSIPFSLVPYLLAITLLNTVRVLIRSTAALVLSAIVLLSTEFITRSVSVADVCALIVLVSGLIWSVIPKEPTVSISPSHANQFQDNHTPQQ